MHVQYAGGDKLSVPIDQIHLIQKYVGSEEKEPKIYKLGGSDWQRVKTKARSSVKDIAQDLIKLYAERQQAPGFSFSKDTPYQREFEAMFPYEETNDQMRSIEEIKEDMEKSVPMDRLLCGDVGYGKTEVAIRAAFKAAIEGKQVAVLVPTTILAQQHYETFKERFSGYPFRIEVLSRFRSKKDQTESMKGLKAGTVDVVIGTHRLLSQDVQFKDLGLVIVDEEQRFGVSHKEKLKRLKTNIDVLTLTATPIPRTLHMSMLGVRDLSVIETPPENRFPVQTYVVEHSNWLVRDAIERELARGGQVFYLFNRVQGIYQMAEQINALVPDAKVAVAHGQMGEQELEKTILDFLDGESDVLVSTTIIETGVDIPNTNTLIVHDADKMGLSQLYQLRGRVGRSNRIAYAYFTYQKDKVLNEVAEKRLAAIREFTELGSGFKIAMRDLSIRGAGNLLGAEQHGFIASVGFDMYSQMLAEEMENSKAIFHGELPKVVEEVETAIEMPIDAYIPPEYIFDDMQKIEIYKKVATIRTIAEADDLVDELIDRFGDMPLAVENLLSIARVKSLCRAFGIETVSYKKGDLILKPDKRQTHRIDGLKLFEMCSKLYKDQVKLINGVDIQICLLGKGKSLEDQVAALEQFLNKYGEVVKPEGVQKHA
jgi:transcription-repair coupling factor (superfamily II helicase)